MVLPVCYHGASMMPRWRLHDAYVVLPRCFHGASMVFRLCVHGLPWCVHGASIVPSWRLHGAPMTLPLCLHGACMTLPLGYVPRTLFYLSSRSSFAEVQSAMTILYVRTPARSSCTHVYRLSNVRDADASEAHECRQHQDQDDYQPRVECLVVFLEQEEGNTNHFYNFCACRGPLSWRVLYLL